MTGTGGKNEDSQAGFQKQWKKTKEGLAFAVAAGMLAHILIDRALVDAYFRCDVPVRHPLLVHYQHLLDFAPENVRQ